MTISDWLETGVLLVGLVGVGFVIYPYLKRKRDQKIQLRTQHAEEKKIKKEEENTQNFTAEVRYRDALRKELNCLRMVGPEFESQTLTFEESFVSLRLSQSWRCEDRFKNRNQEILLPGVSRSAETILSPEEAMREVFPKQHLLLVVGDPGSGKTTLLKFYALTCLDNKQDNLGFGRGKIMPLFFPLRELEFSAGTGEPLPLHEALAAWAKKRYLEISPQQFHQWLQDAKTLVLLDGLDEISDLEKRKQVCRWLENALIGLKNAFFVLSTRPTGYRKIDGLELECDHRRADILDFSDQQQEKFLFKWFRNIFLNDLPAGSGKNEKESKEKEAHGRAQTIIDFLNSKENKSVRELARIPMLLQIMAIIWKDRDYLPGSRAALYDISLNYLLEHRDRRRKLNPVIPAEKARIVLSRLALWMQEKLRSDHASKSDIHEFIRPILQDMENQPQVVAFCQNLRDRAGLIADYGSDRYIFRHKSFMEFLSALQLLIECRDNHDRINIFIDSFNENWWEESLRFFISKSDDYIFDRFISRLLNSDISRQLEANKQTLLLNLVREAPQKKITALTEGLNSERLNDNQKRYIMDCLKTIGTPEVMEALKSFIERSPENDVNLEHARDIVAEFRAREVDKKEKITEIILPTTLPGSFRNPVEDNVDYIKIPGGTYKYSVTKQRVTIPDLYFCKFPVTNKRYRRFISFLAGKEQYLLRLLPPEVYTEKLLEFSKSINEYKEYLGKDPEKWQDILRSSYDEDRRFNGDDQPVVGVNWYAARTYCFWLSCLETVIKHDEGLKDVRQLIGLYRLPTEIEWEWAAGGEPGDSLREYPWSKDKGKPNPELANYGGNVGVTTPVGRYPEGATPQGLMDMAGNVWEWTDNLDKSNENVRTLRGSSWLIFDTNLRISMRCNSPKKDWLNNIGFRVVRDLLSQP